MNCQEFRVTTDHLRKCFKDVPGVEKLTRLELLAMLHEAGDKLAKYNERIIEAAHWKWN